MHVLLVGEGNKENVVIKIKMYDSAFLCRGERKNKQEALEVRKVLSGSESHYSVISQSKYLSVCVCTSKF